MATIKVQAGDFWKSNRISRLFFVIAFGGMLSASLNASIILESATPPSIQYPAAVVFNSSFFVGVEGVRFQITQTTQIDSIGVWIDHNASTAAGGLTGEIFSLPSLNAFPTTDPLSSSGLGRAYFDSPGSAEPSDLVADLSLTLTPGYYALVIGTEPGSEWDIPMGGGDLSPTGPDDFIAYVAGSGFGAPRWESEFDGMSFLIIGEGTPVPEPAPAALMLIFSFAGAILRFCKTNWTRNG
jgi:hypothetical protein